MSISNEAVEAALKTWGDWPEGVSPQEQMTRILEAAAPHLTAPAPDFDAAREAYETAHGKLLRLIDAPDKTIDADEYWATLKQASTDRQRAHNTMMEAWG